MEEQKRYNTVSELAKSLLDKNDYKDFNNEIHSKRLAKMLFSLRCSNGITQKEMANKLNCTQSKISKVESSYDEEIKVKDLLDYAKALNLQLGISYAKAKRSHVDSIKYHALKIKQHLNRLAILADGKDKIYKGIQDFFGEAFFNMLNIFQESFSKLEKNIKRTEILHVTSPVDVEEQTEQFSSKNKEKIKV